MEKEKKLYQGPVPEGYDTDGFRSTGQTYRTDASGKKILFKDDYAKKKDKVSPEKKKVSKKPKQKKPQKMLKKPKAKGIKKISGKKIIMQMAKENSGKLVTEYDPLRERYTNPTQDNRSLFFKEEFKKEQQKIFGGFI